MTSFFHRISKRVASWMGHPVAFVIALLSIAAWALLGPAFGFSDTWQLTVNTGTTIITFLMVFLIQNTQNRDTQALQLKLDELIRATAGARDELIDLEELSDLEIEQLHHEFSELRNQFADKAQKIAEHKKQRAHHRGRKR